MSGWIDRLAAELGEAPLDAEEAERILGASREVAHRVERRLTPLSMFLLGAAVGRELARGEERAPALTDRLRALERLLPQEPEGT